MSWKSSLLVAIPLVVGAASYGATRMGVGFPASLVTSGPKAVIPAPVELGTQEVGATVLARFEVRNGGRSTLTLSQFEASCGCAGVERSIDGTYYRVSDVEVLPGESVELFLRYSARGEAGSSQRSLVHFDTDDPTCHGRRWKSRTAFEAG